MSSEASSRMPLLIAGALLGSGIAVTLAQRIYRARHPPRRRQRSRSLAQYGVSAHVGSSRPQWNEPIERGAGADHGDASHRYGLYSISER